MERRRIAEIEMVNGNVMYSLSNRHVCERSIWLAIQDDVEDVLKRTFLVLRSGWIWQ